MPGDQEAWKSPDRLAKNFNRQAISISNVSISNIFYIHVLDGITRAHFRCFRVTGSVCHHFTASALVALFPNQSLQRLAAHSTLWKTPSEVYSGENVIVVDV